VTGFCRHFGSFTAIDALPLKQYPASHSFSIVSCYGNKNAVTNPQEKESITAWPKRLRPPN
jgi:hypothetical protein